MSNLREISEATFDAEITASPCLTVIDFWADWCMPCKRLSPVLDEIAREHAGNLQVLKLDVDANPGIPSRYGITGIPTLLVFKQGKLVDTLVGFLPKDKIVTRLSPHFN